MKAADMPIFHFDIRNRAIRLADEAGKPCPSALEAIAIAKSALKLMAAENCSQDIPWIEISNARGEYVATVCLDETLH